MNPTTQYRLHKLLVGWRLRCPNCEQGKMFRGLLEMEKTCPNCGVRFERSSGESLGGMMINLSVAEVLTVGGWILTEVFFDFPWQATLAFWVTFNIVFCILFYSRARALWVSFSYLTGGLSVDNDSTKS